MLIQIKNITFSLLLLFPIVAQCAGYDPKKILAETIEARTITASLQEVSEVKLDDPSKYLEKKTCDYYEWIKTYKVLKVYKGKLGDYILVKGSSEICGKRYLELHRPRYSLKGSTSPVIGALCKNKGDGTYSFGQFEYFDDTKEMRKIAEASAKKQTRKNTSSCDVEF